jgi:hypothetical protein
MSVPVVDLAMILIGLPAIAVAVAPLRQRTLCHGPATDRMSGDAWID